MYNEVPKGIVDGQHVNILVLLLVNLEGWGG